MVLKYAKVMLPCEPHDRTESTHHVLFRDLASRLIMEIWGQDYMADNGGYEPTREVPRHSK